MKTNKVVFIRHGESEWNKSNRFCGWHDADLSDQGVQDASKVSAAALLEHKFEFDCAYTSKLTRAQHSLSIILKELNCRDLPIYRDWRLNERHYGNLIGYNKREMADKYGEQQVQIWRRSFDVCPPPITPENPYYNGIRNNPNLQDIPAEQFPDTESLKSVMDRLIPLWKEDIFKKILAGQRVLIVAHGTAVRAIVKYIDNISNENISKMNIPNSIPCVYEFDMETGNKVGSVTYLADENFLNKQMEKTASIGK